MARKPNYSFERNQRAKAKAAKREEKRQARLAAKAGTKTREAAPLPEETFEPPPCNSSESDAS